MNPQIDLANLVYGLDRPVAPVTANLVSGNMVAAVAK